MNESSGVLCPDCKVSIIDIDSYNSGQVCNSCKHRKIWSNKKGVPYIKYKDLSQNEQDKLLRRKLTGQSYYKRKKEKDDSDKNLNYQINSSSEVVKKHNTTRKFKPEVYKYIKDIASESLSVRELREKILEKFPEIENELTYIFLHKTIYAKKLPFRRLTDEEKSNIFAEARSKVNKDLNTDINKVKDIINNNTNTLINEVDNIYDKNNFIDDSNVVTISEISGITSKVTEYKEEYRFEPIINEVKEVLNKKFKEVGCEIGYDFSVEDYIDAFKVLRFLINNFTTIVQKRNDQYDIANNYQTDVVHEMENEISAPGDTYMQDKCHVLRNIRRGYELDVNCINIMKLFLVSMSKRSAELTDIIDKLEKIKNRKDDPKYVPNVDDSMISKYKWAQSTNPSDTKIMDKSLLISNSKKNRRSGNPIFIATCYLSGGGYGVFKKWTKEVSFPTIEEAQKAIDIELENIKKKNKNIMISNFSIYKKN